MTSEGGQVRGQVSLPMYPFPELRDAWAETWTAARDAHPRRRGFPESLLWSDDIHVLWNSPDLVLSQSAPGDTVQLQVLRDGQGRTIEVTLAVRPTNP